jgi:hypothetical protein
MIPPDWLDEAQERLAECVKALRWFMFEKSTFI